VGPKNDDAAAVSRVGFEVSPQDEWPHGPWVGLRIVHSDLEPGSEMLNSISFGWPAVLSGLKTMIERPEIFEAD
jgi:hypothetical protein